MNTPDTPQMSFRWRHPDGSFNLDAWLKTPDDSLTLKSGLSARADNRFNSRFTNIKPTGFGQRLLGRMTDIPD